MSELTFESEEPVFEVGYCCKNCGDEWAEQYDSRTEVFDQYGSVSIHHKDHDHLGMTNCDYCHTIICPVCMLRKHVSVQGRRPINE